MCLHEKLVIQLARCYIFFVGKLLCSVQIATPHIPVSVINHTELEEKAFIAFYKLCLIYRRPSVSLVLKAIATINEGDRERKRGLYRAAKVGSDCE